ncbi:uncharacterized protein BT62DRAFT_510238 [Guyanagaster necrorhizus]|uniref:Uncharacterized protein n=1 Tax=Guyanagaster necrorhizus TaxID=856835 RepID=A0A9P7W1E2_9AGAR|nr:uncharacterized protein BT62DRAFT_510238 [Guyanagaster necrorhizus MCA 3950]KAG7450402.1 hypothetical protein BT62DRAFT_510238 [Guyanagaster necrorhizus MCA 3950]
MRAHNRPRKFSEQMLNKLRYYLSSRRAVRIAPQPLHGLLRMYGQESPQSEQKGLEKKKKRKADADTFPTSQSREDRYASCGPRVQERGVRSSSSQRFTSVTAAVPVQKVRNQIVHVGNQKSDPEELCRRVTCPGLVAFNSFRRERKPMDDF